jgi:hypothetical protein
VAITILYDAFRHHATDFTSIKDADKFHHQKLETQFDEAQEDEERFNRSETFDQYKTVVGYRASQAQTQTRELRASTRIYSNKPTSRWLCTPPKSQSSTSTWFTLTEGSASRTLHIAHGAW